MAWESTEGFFDFGFLPPNYEGDVQVFSMNGNAQGYQKWQKPRAVSMTFIICVSGGGGGGGGRTGATTTARGGGGGGACSGTSIWMGPALFLPNNLSILIGGGGTGGAANTNGGNGANSFVAMGVGVTDINTIPNILLKSGSTAPGGGAGGGTSGSAAGGGVPTVISDGTIGHWAYKGFTKYNVGLVGATGGLATAGAVGTSVGNGWNVCPFTPGAGGASVSAAATGFAGGNVSIQAAADWTDGGIQQPTNVINGGTGNSGGATSGQGYLQFFSPLLMLGGSGGGSTDNAAGGAGGTGALGCGGGGGGGGTTGGTGGNGGDGFVVIISW